MTPSPEPRSHRKGLTRDLVVERTLEMIDEVGPDGLTIRGLAQRLGVEPMSIYAHIPSKAALLDAVVARVLAAMELPDPRLRWDQVLIDGFGAYRKALLKHPRAVPLVALRTPTGAQRLGLMEASLAALKRGGLKPERMVVAQVTLVAYVLGFVLQEAAGRELPTQAWLAETLRGAPADYPHVLEVAPVLARFSVDARFDTGLRLIVSALAVGDPAEEA